MPQIDLSTLDGTELRQLLDSARRQGQAAQTYEILQEMEARRQRGPRPLSLSPKRRGAKPRMISLELGDPLDRTADPLRDEAFDDLPPLRLVDDPPPEPPLEAATSFSEPPAPKSRGWAHWGALIFAVGLGGGVAAGWWAAGGADNASPKVAAAPPPAPQRLAVIQTAALAPAAPGVPPANAETPATPTPALAPTPAQVQPPSTDAAPAPPADTAPTPAPVVEANAEADDAAAKPVQAASAEDKGCGSEPADRAICADAKLRRLQGELRGAYAEALKAHEDRTLLRERQLAWAQARNEVTDPAELAKLYRERIGRLKAATADALRHRDAPLSPRTAARPG